MSLKSDITKPYYITNTGYVKAKDPSYPGIPDATVVRFQITPNAKVVHANNILLSELLDSGLANALVGCPFVIYPPTSLLYLNFSNNHITNMFCPLIGLEKLKGFDGSNCNLQNITQDFLRSKYFPDLEVLYLNGNNLGPQSKRFPDLLKDVKKLREFHLAANRIQILPYDSFEHLSSLETLDLSRNILCDINVNISHLRKLKFINLQENQLSLIGSDFRKELDHANSLRNQSIMLDIGGNPLSCGCDSLSFISWLQNTQTFFIEKNNLNCHGKKQKIG